MTALTKHEFLKKVETLLELDSGSLNGSEELASLPSWDSLTLMGFIAMADGQFGVRFTGKQIADCKTVDDLARLLGPKIQG